jgi:glucokinase
VLTIGVDIGGTKVAVGVVDADGKILATTRRDTPADDPMRTADVIADAARELMAHHEPAAIGLAAAGFVDADCSVVLFAPNLAWRDEPLRDAMAQRLAPGRRLSRRGPASGTGGPVLREASHRPRAPAHR